MTPRPAAGLGVRLRVAGKTDPSREVGGLAPRRPERGARGRPLSLLPLTAAERHRLEHHGVVHVGCDGGAHSAFGHILGPHPGAHGPGHNAAAGDCRGRRRGGAQAGKDNNAPARVGQPATLHAAHRQHARQHVHLHHHGRHHQRTGGCTHSHGNHRCGGRDHAASRVLALRATNRLEVGAAGAGLPLHAAACGLANKQITRYCAWAGARHLPLKTGARKDTRPPAS